MGGFGNPTLHPDDLKNFWKRLRKYLLKNGYSGKIKYFACGEYGTTTYRPHYHAILFNYDFPDKKAYQKKKEYTIYTSQILDEIWTHGECKIGEVNFDTCSYVARYICDKLNGPAAIYYQEQNIIPEFVRMSRRPAIGKNHFLLYQSDIYPHDSCIINGQKSKPPRYYDKLLKSVNPQLSEKIKLNRIINSNKISIYEKMPKRLSVKNRIALSNLKLKDRSL